MKKIGIYTLGMLASLMILLVGCEEWEEADDFNTSQGAGANVNLSGTYNPRSGDVLAGTNVTYLILTQTGNVLEGRDNNNSSYDGTMGSPGVVAPPAEGVYPAGASMLQSQVSFTGINSANGLSVEFVGTVRAVAVTEVIGVDRDLTVQEVTPTDQFDLVNSYDYTINEANTQYVLEGNWTEGSSTYQVDGFARGAGGTF